MSTWLLSIAGIVVIGALIEVLLSDSHIHKFVRSIYAFFVLFVIAQPIPGFFRNTANAIQAGGALELDTELMQKINSQTAAATQRNAAAALETAGFEGVIVAIDARPDTTFKISAVYVNALGASCRNQTADIDMKQEIIKIVRAVCNVSEEVVYYVD